MLDFLKCFSLSALTLMMDKGAVTAGYMTFAKCSGCYDYLTGAKTVHLNEIVHFFDVSGDELGYLSMFNSGVILFDPPRVWHAQALLHVRQYKLTPEAIGRPPLPPPPENWRDDAEDIHNSARQ